MFDINKQIILIILETVGFGVLTLSVHDLLE